MFFIVEYFLCSNTRVSKYSNYSRFVVTHNHRTSCRILVEHRHIVIRQRQTPRDRGDYGVTTGRGIRPERVEGAYELVDGLDKHLWRDVKRRGVSTERKQSTSRLKEGEREGGDWRVWELHGDTAVKWDVTVRIKPRAWRPTTRFNGKAQSSGYKNQRRSTGWPKSKPQTFVLIFAKYWPVFKFFFTSTFAGQFAIKWLLNIMFSNHFITNWKSFNIWRGRG